MGIIKFIKSEDFSSTLKLIWKYTFTLCCYYWVVKFWNKLDIFHLSYLEGILIMVALKHVFSDRDREWEDED